MVKIVLGKIFARYLTRCILELPVRGENILENTVCGVNKVSSEAQRGSGKNCPGKMFARYLTMYSRNTSAWGKYSRKTQFVELTRYHRRPRKRVAKK